jgi:hypothetical protein
MNDFTVIQAEQRSTAWFQSRAGRVTGSRAKDVVDFLKSGKESADRRDYRIEKVAEILSGRVEDDDSYKGAVVQRGIDKEPDALAAYEVLTGNIARRTGFLAHNVHRAGCSLDGHVGDFAGLLEVKCPKTATHLTWIRAGVVPAMHLPQILHNLWMVPSAQWLDFLSFDDRLPADLQAFLVRVKREDVDLAGYEKAVLKFLAEVDTEVNALRGWKVVAA